MIATRRRSQAVLRGPVWMGRPLTPADRILGAFLRARGFLRDWGFFEHPLPGEVYVVSEPEYVGSIPVRSELRVLPLPEGPSLAEQEMAEFGNIAIRRFMAMSDPRPDNTIPISEDPVLGEPVLIRGRRGGFYQANIQQDAVGWFVWVGRPGDRHRLAVTMGNRNRWVVSGLI